MYDFSPDFWADEILWMYSNGIVDEDDTTQYLELNREGRCKRYKVRMNRKHRTIAMGVFNAYNRALMNKGRFEWERLYAILARMKGTVERCVQFDYIFIDEAQDLSLVKMMLILRMCRRGDENLFVAMDKNQSLYGHRWSFKRDLNLEVHVKKLDVIHRNTYEVQLLAGDLKKIDDTLIESEDIYENEVSNKVSNKKPKIIRCDNSALEMDFISNLLLNINLEKYSVAILLTDYSRINPIIQHLRDSHIKYEYYRDEKYSPNTPGLKVSTIHSAKGLGFGVVIIPFFEEGIYPKSTESILRTLKKHNDSEEEYIDPEDAIAEEISNSRRLV